jgi:uncharacterized membrane protein SpoIIM required for sporulation
VSRLGALVPQPYRARVDAVREQAGTFTGSHRSTTILIAMGIASFLLILLPHIPPLNLLLGANPWYDAFANAGVFVLLAMGLNVVVGLAGLLDLGYAAFFAIGAYTYAYSNSSFSGIDMPFFPMLFVGAVIAAVFGIALGAPTLLLLVSNGLMLGSFFALYASRGLGFELGGWLIIHGGTELLAVALCGGAGLAIADAFLFPGQKTRLQSLAERGRVAGLVALGAVVMLAIAGVLEGIGRQVITDDFARYGIGIGMLALWSLYFLSGRRAQGEDGHD